MVDNKFYENLQIKLSEQFEWPHVYMFKFIIPADNKKLALLESLFNKEAIITTRQSKTNKFISLTAKELMIKPSDVINIYKKAEKIEGIISL